MQKEYQLQSSWTKYRFVGFLFRIAIIYFFCSWYSFQGQLVITNTSWQEPRSDDRLVWSPTPRLQLNMYARLRSFVIWWTIYHSGINHFASAPGSIQVKILGKIFVDRYTSEFLVFWSSWKFSITLSIDGIVFLELLSYYQYSYERLFISW